MMKAKSFSKAVCLGAASYLVLAMSASGQANAQSSTLPAVTVDAPKPNAVRRATPPRRSAASRGPVRRATVPPMQRGEPVRFTAPANSIMGRPLAPFAGGEVARGGQVGLLGNRDYMDTPFATVAFTEKKIANQQAQTITDVITNDPSVQAGTGAATGGYYDQYVIRGMSAGVRDIAFNGLHGVVPYSFQAAYGYERVEVVKGPAVLLTGHVGALGGVVNVVPKRATDDPITRITGMYNSNSSFGTHLDVGRRYGENKEWGIRFNGVFQDGTTSIDHNERQLGLATLGVDFRSENFRWSADLGYQRDYVRGLRQPLTLLPGEMVPTPPNNKTNPFQPWEYADDKTVYGATRAEVDLSEYVTVFGAFGGNLYQSMLVLSNPTVTGAGVIDAGVRTTDFENRTWTGEVGLKGKLSVGGVTHQWVASATALNYPFFVGQAAVGGFLNNLYNPVTYPKPAIAFGKPSQLAEITMKSVAIADTMSVLNDRIQLTVGARQQQVDQVFFGQGGEVGHLSPTVGLVVKPLEHVSVYATYMQSLEAGETAPSNAANPGALLSPAVTENKEVGIKIDLGVVGAQAAFFELTRQLGGVDPATQVFGLIGQQRNRGAEMLVFGEPAKGFRIFGGATLLDPVIASSPDNPAVVGKDVMGVARFYATAGMEVDLPWISGLTVSGRAVRSGAMFADTANLQRLDGWTRADFGARYTFKGPTGKPVTVRADVLNAFDAAYWQYSSGLVIGTPRTYKMSATFDF